MRTRKANLHERTVRDPLSGKNTAAYFDPLGEAKAPPFFDVLQMNTKEGAQAPTNPRGRLENQAVVHGDAKAPSLYNILQQVVNVKQKTVLTNEEGANVAVQPTVRPNESSVALGGAKAPSVNSILQKVLDVKQGKGHGQHSPFWWA